MTTASTAYKCPSCGASIEYEPSSQLMSCDYCLSRFTPEQVEASARSPLPVGTPSVSPPIDTSPSADSTPPPASAEWDAPTEDDLQWTLREGTPLSAAEKNSLAQWECPSCGAHVLSDKKLISTRCGYCNSTLVLASTDVDTAMPEVIIPFAIDRDSMVAAFLESTAGRFLLPGRFKDTATIREAQGTYVPYWLVDGLMVGTFHYSGSDSHENRSYSEVTTTVEDYDVIRKARARLTALPVCADTTAMRARTAVISHVPTSALVPFQGAYLSGYVTPAPSLSAVQAKDMAYTIANSSFSERVKASVRHQTVLLRRKTTFLTHPTMTYALIPVWLLNIDYRNATYKYIIDGHSGEVYGDYPVSVAKVRSIITACAGIAFIASLWLGDVITQTIMNLIGI